MVLKGKRANPDTVGDQDMILAAPATDTEGRVWPKGTLYVPLSGGAKGIGVEYQNVTILGELNGRDNAIGCEFLSSDNE